MKYIILLSSLLAMVSCKPKLTPNTDTTIPIEINSTQLGEMIAKGQKMILLDVRTPGEISDGKISNALEIDYFGDDFAAKIDQLNKDDHYIIYCKSGGRSAKSVAIMKEKGFTKCTNLEGGYTAWSAR